MDSLGSARPSSKPYNISVSGTVHYNLHGGVIVPRTYHRNRCRQQSPLVDTDYHDVIPADVVLYDVFGETAGRVMLEDGQPPTWLTDCLDDDDFRLRGVWTGEMAESRKLGDGLISLLLVQSSSRVSQREIRAN